MDLFTFENGATLAVLIFLQAVLGFDNLLYISIESQRAPLASRTAVRRNGILIALVLRVVLLFLVMRLMEDFTRPLLEIRLPGVVEGGFGFTALVFLAGGGFLMWTALKEIAHLLAIEDLASEPAGGVHGPVQATLLIVAMNLVFSFDSILSALAISRVFAVLATAIVISGLAMLVLADRVSAFLERNRKYEVLGLFILLIVGVVLLGEGGHEAGLRLLGHPVEPMAKSTFYFSIFVLVVVDVLQSGYQRKLEAQRAGLQGVEA